MTTLAMDRKPASGIMITTPDGMTLFLKRAAGGDHAGTWAFPGGGIENGETPEQAAKREAAEEIGYSPEGSLEELDHKADEQGTFTTFHHRADEPFVPRLNSEHTEHTWASLIDPPSPLHPGVKKLLDALDEIDKAELAEDEEWKEGDHPRADNGQFGNSSSSSKPASNSSGKSSKTSVETSKNSSTPSIDISSMKKTSGKLGSNEGGVYAGEGGKKYYVKKPSSKAHVTNEKTAAKLYQLAGVNTLPYVDAGPDHVATEWQKLDKNNVSDLTLEERKEASKDFAVHAWLSNWDAAASVVTTRAIITASPPRSMSAARCVIAHRAGRKATHSATK